MIRARPWRFLRRSTTGRADAPPPETVFFHNDIIARAPGGLGVFSRYPIRIHDTRTTSPTFEHGNVWGHPCGTVFFTAGVDTNASSVADLFPYGIPLFRRATFPDPSPSLGGCDVDRDGFLLPSDCDDSDPNIFPGSRNEWPSGTNDRGTRSPAHEVEERSSARQWLQWGRARERAERADFATPEDPWMPRCICERNLVDTNNSRCPREARPEKSNNPHQIPCASAAPKFPITSALAYPFVCDCHKARHQITTACRMG